MQTDQTKHAFSPYSETFEISCTPSNENTITHCQNVMTRRQSNGTIFLCASAGTILRKARGISITKRYAINLKQFKIIVNSL